MADAILKVGSVGSDASSMVPLPDPAEMTIHLQDIDNSSTGRSASGKMLRDRIAGGETAKRKIECEWNAIDSDKVQLILSMVGSEFISLSYPDPYTNNTRIATFYVGDRSAEMYAYKFINGSKHLYSTFKFNFIEE